MEEQVQQRLHIFTQAEVVEQADIQELGVRAVLLEQEQPLPLARVVAVAGHGVVGIIAVVGIIGLVAQVVGLDYSGRVQLGLPLLRDITKRATMDQYVLGVLVTLAAEQVVLAATLGGVLVVVMQGQLELCGQDHHEHSHQQTLDPRNLAR
jgi:hypothetical protein